MQLTWQQMIGIDESHLVKIDNGLGGQVRINKAIFDDLTRLKASLDQCGLSIGIVSGFRSFEKQLNIWNEKWRGYRPVYSRHGRPLNMSHLSDIEKYKAIALWSALPGMSRHHWGTDLDIFLSAPIRAGHRVQLTPEEFANGGPCSELEKWLSTHIKEFGFFRPYIEFKGGVSVEPWHISHYQVASQILIEFDLNQCKNYLAESQIEAPKFIQSQLQHYFDQFFVNINTGETV